jgi:hypothetical protein
MMASLTSTAEELELTHTICRGKKEVVVPTHPRLQNVVSIPQHPLEEQSWLQTAD